MAFQIVLVLSDEAAALVEKHVGDLGYDDASDYAFELLRNHTAERENRLYTRMPIGESNPVFGRSRRETADAERRAQAEALERAQREAAAVAKADEAKPA